MNPSRGTYEAIQDEEKPSLLDCHRAYTVDGDIYLVYDNRLWRRTGQTHNPRVIALNDAVGWHGDLLTVSIDGTTIRLQHKHAGTEHRIHAADRTKWCFVTFEEVDSI